MKTIRVRSVAEDEDIRSLVKVAHEAVKEEHVPNNFACERETDRPREVLGDAVI